MRTVLVATALLLSVACDRAPTTPRPAAETAPVTSVPVVVPTASASASASASAIAPAPASASASAPSSSPTLSDVPHVRVENIGMHIGGGPNDAVNKAPIADSVAPHFDELRACWAKVDDPKHGGDFGVDLLIQPDGGRAKVTHPRTAIHPDAFRDCVVAVFEGVDFKRPLKGLTMVSYSLRFAP